MMMMTTMMMISMMMISMMMMMMMIIMMMIMMTTMMTMTTMMITIMMMNSKIIFKENKNKDEKFELLPDMLILPDVTVSQHSVFVLGGDDSQANWAKVAVAS